MENEALERQLEELHDAGFRWALGCSGWNREQAEEILQMTYLKIIEGKAKFDGRSSFKTWLFSLIRISAAENRRREFLQDFRLSRFFLKRPGLKPSATPESLLNDFQRHQQLIHLVTSLPRRQREVLQLVFYHDLTIEEAAGILEISLGSARAHYERGKKRLREKLETKER